MAAESSQPLTSNRSSDASTVKSLLNVISAMDTEPGQYYTVKLSLNNNIYTTKLQGFQIDDLNNRGERSSVVQLLSEENRTGCATGSFPYPMEILYVEAIAQQEAIEVEVSILILLYNNMPYTDNNAKFEKNCNVFYISHSKLQLKVVII